MRAIDGATAPDLGAILGEALAKVPEWIRQDLPSRDPVVRARAEETLAAIIAAALVEKASASARTA